MSSNSESPGEQLENLRKIRIEPLVLSRLLAKIGTPVNAGLIEQACLTGQPDDAAMNPADRLGKILAVAQKKNIQVAQLRWDRFDRRHLPALVLYTAAWHSVEHGDEGDVLITGSDGNSLPLPADHLAEAPVLWMRVPAADLHATELLKSGASRLLLAEVLKDKLWLLEALVATLVVNILAVATSQQPERSERLPTFRQSQ